jgi:hypothetical protein
MRKAAELLGIQPELRAYLTHMENVASGGLKWVLTPSTVSTTPLATAWTRSVLVQLQDDEDVVCDWYTADIATGNSIADTSSAGTASIVSTTLSIVEGEATVVVSGDAQAWLGGTSQVETITCTAGESTGAGDITMTVTAAGMTNSPKAVVVPIGAEDDTVGEVGALLRTALGDDEDVSAFFTVSGAAGAAILTAITPAANDATLAFGFVDTDTTGVTFGASTDTTAGVAKETDTFTVVQASIAGSTVAAKTSVETFEA